MTTKPSGQTIKSATYDVIQPPSNVSVEDRGYPVLYDANGKPIYRAVGFRR
jgi:hypothetical protein